MDKKEDGEMCEITEQDNTNNKELFWRLIALRTPDLRPGRAYVKMEPTRVRTGTQIYGWYTSIVGLNIDIETVNTKDRRLIIYKQNFLQCVCVCVFQG